MNNDAIDYISEMKLAILRKQEEIVAKEYLYQKVNEQREEFLKRLRKFVRGEQDEY